MPHEFRIAFQIAVDGRLAPSDLAGWGPWRDQPAVAISNQMRSMAQRGVLSRPDPPSISYELSHRMREAMFW
jgi:hypothetical protein